MRRIAYPVLKKLLKWGTGFHECRETVSNVSGRQHAELPTKPSRTAAIVGHGHDRGDRVAIAIPCLLTQAFEHCWKTCTATDRDDARCGYRLHARRRRNEARTGRTRDWL
jgi:hypothetical protein